MASGSEIQVTETLPVQAEVTEDLSTSHSAGNIDDNSAPDKAPSLRETLLSSVEEVRKAERARDEKGKFATEPKPELKAAPEKAAPIVPKTENVQPAVSKPVGPPSSWSKEAKDIWDALPDAAKAAAVKREDEVSKGFDEYRGKTAQLQEISQVLEPLRSVLQQNGIQTEAQAVRRLVEWEGKFRNPQTRMQAFQDLAQQYGVDLSQAQNSPGASAPSDIPAQLRPVIDQFGNLVQDVNGLKSELQRRDQETVTAKLSEFAKDKPHFEKVRKVMGQLMVAGIVQPTDLEGAYQKAISLDPEVSAAIAAENDAARIAEQNKIQADKAAKARIAAVSPSVRAPSGPVVNGAKGAKAGARGSILQAIEQLRGEQRA